LGRLSKALRRHALIGLDTSVLSYSFTSDREFGSVADEVLACVRDGRGHPTAVLSEVAMLEIQVLGLRLGGEAGRRQLETWLSQYPNARRLPVDARVCGQAALMRYGLRLKTADALIAATAISAGADALVTNDRTWKRLPLPVYLLSDYLAS
jgi:predicted nucleic acid-binding protein